MKRYLLLPLTCILLLIPSCATTGPSAPSPDQMALTVRTAARIGTRELLRREPGAKPYFQAAVLAIDVATVAGNVDPVTLKLTLLALPVKEVKTDLAMSGIQDALDLYESFVGAKVKAKLDANKYAIPVLRGLRDGISDSLGGK